MAVLNTSLFVHNVISDMFRPVVGQQHGYHSYITLYLAASLTFIAHVGQINDILLTLTIEIYH